MASSVSLFTANRISSCRGAPCPLLDPVVTGGEDMKMCTGQIGNDGASTKEEVSKQESRTLGDVQMELKWPSNRQVIQG